MSSVPLRDGLDDKVNRTFAGKVVRKDLVRKVKVGANVPVFVLEFLLGKYRASSDEMAIQMGLQVVNDTLANNYIRNSVLAVRLGPKPTRDLPSASQRRLMFRSISRSTANLSRPLLGAAGAEQGTYFAR
jgi:hypothetical protein